MALGDVDEELLLQTFADSDWNSFHAADLQNLKMVGRSINSSERVVVDVRRLDGLWPDVIEAGSTVFLKSDTQGHDPQVLAGTGEYLQQVGGLLLEASIVPFYEGEPALGEVLAAVETLGFAPSGFFPVARDKNSIALATLDVCFVRVDR